VIANEFAAAFKTVARTVFPDHYPGCEFLQHKCVAIEPKKIQAMNGTIKIQTGKYFRA
jgi:hypothetical protein